VKAFVAILAGEVATLTMHQIKIMSVGWITVHKLKLAMDIHG